MSRTDAEKAERKARRRAWRKKASKDIQRTVHDLVNVAEKLFPEDGNGRQRRAWVALTVAKLIKTPAGDVLEAEAVGQLIDLAVAAL